MGRQLRVLITHFDDITLKHVEARLANWLLQRCPDPNANGPVKIELTTTKRILASELGTVSETLSRMLAKFRHRRLIQVSGKTITILSPVKLAAMLDET